MTRHTPGPWLITYGNQTGRPRQIVGSGRGITSWGGISRAASEEGAANARLLASAPLMLEALKRIRDNCADNDPENWIWRTAEQAIAQAEGK